MNGHLPEDLLRRFAEGDLDETSAVEAALHLDACATCTAHVESIDPFVAAFETLPDPVPPPTLVDDVLAAWQRPARSASLEIALGGGLLAAAGALVFAFGDPVAAAVRVGVVLDALGIAASKVALTGGPSLIAMSIAFVAVAGMSAAVARISPPALERRLS